MSSVCTHLFLVTLLYLWSPLRGAVRDVTCTYLSSCLLPCDFVPGTDVVLHWLCPPEGPTPVHTYYHSQDQLGHQNPRYKGRTALFIDQISKGNASLMLSRTQVTDSGKYKCYTSTIKGNNEEFVNVNVQAPVVEVELQQEGDELKCIAKDVFPKPNVTWTPSTRDSTEVKETENGLYIISSSVRLSELTADQYILNVSTAFSWRSATYRRRDPVTVSEVKVTVPCVDIETSIKSLTWTFNQTQNILNKTGSEVVSKSWKPFVEHVSDSGSLVLKGLTSDHQGQYSCVLSTDTNTYMSRTEVYVYDKATESDHTVTVVVSLLVGLAVLGLTGAGLWWYCTKRKPRAPSQTICLEVQPLQEMTDRKNNSNGNHCKHVVP